MAAGSATTLAFVLVASSRLFAATQSVGSVVAEGDLWIDNRPVTVSGTVFDGSMLQTGRGPVASADVRFGDDSRLTLRGDTRGTFYRGRLVLHQGEVEVAAPATFRTEVSGLAIHAAEPHSAGIISVRPDGTVDIAAESGSFQVADGAGHLVAEVNAHEPAALYPRAGGGWLVNRGSAKGTRDADHRCYVDDDDDRDCDRRHHHHRSR